MKKYLLLTSAICHLTFYMAFAQDTTLPQGTSQIHLYSGKVIKYVKLWKIDTSKVEYVIDGNLGDLKTSDVMKIETPYYLLTFDDEHHLKKRHYDCIIPYYGDTLWGIIQNTNKETILYIPAGSTQQKTIMQSGVKSYLQWDAPPDVTNKNSASVKNEKKTITADTNKIDEYYISKKQAEKKVADWQYFHQSYQRGVSDAAKNSQGGWGAGGFCSGAAGCFPLLSLSAVNSNVNIKKIPPGVDEKLYSEGFKNQTTQKRVKAASTGAITALGIIGFIFLIAFASLQ